MLKIDKIKEYSDDLNVLLIDNDLATQKDLEPVLSDLFTSYSFEASKVVILENQNL